MQLQRNKSMPGAYDSPTITETRDGWDYVRMLPKLALATECNIFGEQDHRIRKRIALAHFHHVYTLAQDNLVRRSADPEITVAQRQLQHRRRTALWISCFHRRSTEGDTPSQHHHLSSMLVKHPSRHFNLLSPSRIPTPSLPTP